MHTASQYGISLLLLYRAVKLCHSNYKQFMAPPISGICGLWSYWACTNRASIVNVSNFVSRQVIKYHWATASDGRHQMAGIRERKEHVFYEHFRVELPWQPRWWLLSLILKNFHSFIWNRPNTYKHFNTPSTKKSIHIKASTDIMWHQNYLIRKKSRLVIPPQTIGFPLIKLAIHSSKYPGNFF